MDDERFYEEVVAELGRGVRRDGLWAKALAQSLGDENITKALYLKLRVEQLIEVEKVRLRQLKEAEKRRLQRVKEAEPERYVEAAMWKTLGYLILAALCLGVLGAILLS